MPDLPDIPLNPAAPRPNAVPSRGAMQARAAAGESLGRSVSKAAKETDQTLFEIQDFKDKGALAELRLSMLKAEKEHAMFRQESLDESTWGPHMQTLIQGVNQQAGSLQMLPQNQQRAQQLAQEWAEMAELGVAEDMQGQAIERATIAQGNLLAEQRKNRDWDGAAETIGDMHILPEEADTLLAGLGDEAKRARLEDFGERALAAQGEEIAVVREELENDPDFRDSEKGPILRRLERNEARDYANHLQDLTQRMTAEPHKFITEEQVQAEKPKFGKDEDWERFMGIWRVREAQTPAAMQAAIASAVRGLWQDYEVLGLKDDEEAFRDRRNKLAAAIAPFALRKDMKSVMTSFGRTSWENITAAEGNITAAQDQNKAEKLQGLNLEARIKIGEEFDGDEERWEEHKFAQALPGLEAEFPDKSGAELWKLHKQHQLFVQGRSGTGMGKPQNWDEGKQAFGNALREIGATDFEELMRVPESDAGESGVIRDKDAVPTTRFDTGAPEPSAESIASKGMISDTTPMPER